MTLTGAFEVLSSLLAQRSQPAHLAKSFDSMTARTHVSAATVQGRKHRPALGRLRYCFSAKIHIKTDFDGNPLDFHPTGGEASDSKQFETLLDIGPIIRPPNAMTDKGYDSQANRAAKTRAQHHTGYPKGPTLQTETAFSSKTSCKLPARLEQAIGRLKLFKRGHALQEERY